ncbi:amino acid carrier protein, partial [Clostridium butyricum]
LLVIILLIIKELPAAFELIFKEPLDRMAACRWFGGSVLSQTISKGIARGAYSNEAGMGSAPIAHSAAVTDHPVRQGFWGVFE